MYTKRIIKEAFSMANTYFHGHITVPTDTGIQYLLPVTTVNDVIADSSGKRLNTVINDLKTLIATTDNTKAISNTEIDTAFSTVGLV